MAEGRGLWPFPETPPPGMHPEEMSPHLNPTWYKVRNEIVGDQTAIKHHLENIKQAKAGIRFFKARIIINKKALGVIGAIKE